MSKKKNNFSQRIKEIEEVKENFLLMASHQMKVPLNTINLNLQMILNGDLGQIKGKMREVLVEILKINKQVIELVKDFLLAFEIEMNKKKASLRSSDLVGIAREVIKEAGVVLEEKGLKISFSFWPKRFSKVKIDADKFREILQNLLSNAIKYNHLHGRVTVKLKQTKKKLVLTVGDTGIGIATKDQPKIFSKFFRSSDALKVNEEGSGLGLFVVKAYSESLGGRAWFESKKNKGTTFFVEIPISN